MHQQTPFAGEIFFPLLTASTSEATHLILYGNSLHAPLLSDPLLSLCQPLSEKVLSTFFSPFLNGNIFFHKN